MTRAVLVAAARLGDTGEITDDDVAGLIERQAVHIVGSRTERHG
jgi:hypothetical protein